jgi:hypothetical protein
MSSAIVECAEEAPGEWLCTAEALNYVTDAWGNTEHEATAAAQFLELLSLAAERNAKGRGAR